METREDLSINPSNPVTGITLSVAHLHHPISQYGTVLRVTVARVAFIKSRVVVHGLVDGGGFFV